MQRPGKIKDVKKKIHVRARKALWHGIGDFVWASGSGGGEVGGNHKKFSKGGVGANGRVRLLWARHSTELRKVAFGWKVGSQVIGED